MKVRIAKTFDFDAAHFLPKVPADHKCHRMHGHTYRVEIICEGEPDERGMVIDYAEIADAWAPLHDRLDHRILNDDPELPNPTTELLAPFILDFLKWGPLGKKSVLKCVRVYESNSTWCEAE